jgi:hypothetical protein
MKLEAGVREKIEQVFALAVSQGRRMLYEFEVYAVLEALGLSAPRFAYVREIHEVDDALLKRFSGQAVVKIVCPDLAHKSKYGGVKRIDHLDPLFVRFVLHHMREEVLSHFPRDRRPAIDGFLIVETIPFTQALGNEILIGVKEDPSFGPVLTLSKGGDDAEFFAAHYDPANLLIAPIAEEEALSLVRGTKIRHRYEQMGRKEACGQIAHALFEIGRLAGTYAFTRRARRPTTSGPWTSTRLSLRTPADLSRWTAFWNSPWPGSGRWSWFRCRVPAWRDSFRPRASWWPVSPVTRDATAWPETSYSCCGTSAGRPSTV